VIITSLDGSAHFYRAHTPEWASQPLSGAGAARHGGRLNRPGLHALYLAVSQATAIAEYQQLASIMPPCTLVTYHVTLQGIVDFRNGYDPSTWSPLWQELSCNWRRMAMIDAIEPPSWVLADEVLRAGHTGVLFPSVHGHGINLVIYPDALQPDDRLAVHDPLNALPRDRGSWAGGR
jgi:RES domain-containing protein